MRARLPAAALVIAVGAVAFGALGVALGAIARDVRAVVAARRPVLLPIAVVGLIPVGIVSSGAYDVDRGRSRRSSRSARRCAASTRACAGLDLAERLAHLAALTLGYGVLARVALRRFG